MPTFFHVVVFSLFFPIAKSCEINQSKKFSLLSQLALSSQNKFLLKSPPKSRKKAAGGQVIGSPDADLVAELDGDTNEGFSPTGHCENCLSAGLDCAISDLVLLDSQAEMEQGIFLREGTTEIGMRLQVFSVCFLCCVTIQKLWFFPIFLPLHFLKIKMMIQASYFNWSRRMLKSRSCPLFPNP